MNKRGIIHLTVPIIIVLMLFFIFGIPFLFKISNGLFFWIVVGMIIGTVIAISLPFRLFVIINFVFVSTISIYHFYISPTLEVPDYPAKVLVVYGFYAATTTVVRLFKFLKWV